MKALLVLGACVLVAGGYALTTPGAADKAGGSGRPITLRLAFTDGSDTAPGRAATYFADRVRTLSGGHLRVRIVWQAGSFQRPGWELRVVDMARTGKADLALAPARAWAERGASSLDALMAPFLLTDDVAVGRVAVGPLTRELLDGVAATGAVGLAMVSGGLRHPFAFRRPLLRRSDYAGTAIRAPASTLTYDAWRAMGARPVDVSGQALPKAVAAGRVAAAESGYEFTNGLPQKAVAAGDVTPFARIDVLAVGKRTLARLEADDITVLRRAATDTARRAVARAPQDQQLARAYCAAGGAVVQAEPADVRALGAATAPVTAQLERDPRTRREIALIRSWRSTASGGVSCGNPRLARPTHLRGATSSVLDGVYRIAWTEEEAIRAGISRSYAHNTSGVQTWTLHGNHFVYHTDNGLDPPDCHGPLKVRGHRLFADFNAEQGDCNGVLDATWSLDGDRLRLKLHDAVRDDEIWWGSKAWRRIAR